MILIDYNAIAISNVVTQKLDIDEDLIRHMILNSLRMHRSKNRSKFGELVICCDGKRNWRYDYFPNYKFKRRDARKTSSMDWNELFRITNMVLEELKSNFPYKVIEHERCEADDIIAAIAENTQEFGHYEEVLIISSDKDFAQLQKFKNVKQYSPIKKSWIVEKTPRKQLAELILKGDQADGIPNVLSSDHVFVDGIRQTPMRSKQLEKLIEDPKSNGEDIYRNYLRNRKLIDLSETPEDIKNEVIHNFKKQDKWHNKGKVFPYLVEKRCRRLLEDVRDFI
tara:strand:+ start:9228 stop:10070 length:843 start_codon:yes stop_codon:yes gene_type:complete